MMRRWVLFVALSVLVFGNLCAGTLPGSLQNEFAAPINLERVTVGVNYESIRRAVQLETDEKMDLDAASVSAFLGYDLSPAFTVFATAGGAWNEDAEDDREAGLKWSVGGNVNLWKWDFPRPSGLDGDRFTIRLFVEVASHETDEEEFPLDWTEFFVALPFAYEATDSEGRTPDEGITLALFAGPAVSQLDGDIGDADAISGKLDFNEDADIGAIGGMTIYFTRYFSMGGQVLFFGGDDASGQASLRFHF